MIIQHNISAINSGRNLKKNQGALNKSLERLSSGYKINRSGDDAAGLAISEGLRAIINGTKQAENNALDGIGLIHTAEGAMQELHSMLNRAYELSISASNGTYSDTNREIIQKEIDELSSEIKRIANFTDFNGIPVLKGAGGGSSVTYSGTLPAWVVTDASIPNGHLSGTYTTQEIFKDSSGNLTTYNIDHQAAKLDFSYFDTNVTNARADLKNSGFYTTCFTCNSHYSIRFTDGTSNSREQSGNHTIFNIGIDNINTSEDLVNAIIAGTDAGNPNSHYTKLAADPANPNQLIVYDDRSMKASPTSASGSWQGWDNPNFNINENSCSGYGLFGKGIATKKDGVGDIQLQIGPSEKEILEIDLPDISLENLGIYGISVLTQKQASASIDRLKNSIDFLSGERGRMGAYENRLEHARQTLANSQENLTAAESRIRDANMAEEFTVFTKSNIILQSAQSMLAQANSMPQNIMRLLQ